MKINTDIRIKLLDERIDNFAVMLGNQVRKLGAGNIPDIIKAALSTGDYETIAVNIDVMHRLLVWGYIETCQITGRRTFSDVSIIVSRYLEKDSMVLIPKVITPLPTFDKGGVYPYRGMSYVEESGLEMIDSNP